MRPRQRLGLRPRVGNAREREKGVLPGPSLPLCLQAQRTEKSTTEGDATWRGCSGEALGISSQPEVSQGPLKRVSSSKAFLFLEMQRPAPASHWMPQHPRAAPKSSKRDSPSCLSWAALQGPPPKCSPSLPQLCMERRKGARTPLKAKQPSCLGRSCFSLASGHSPSDLRLSRSPQTGLQARHTRPGPSQGSHA